MEYKVELKNDGWYITGLPEENYMEDDGEGVAFEEPSPPSPDTWIKVPRGSKGIDLFEFMYEALYGELQTNDKLTEGDTFDTPVGKFICEGVHVLPHDEVANKYMREINDIYQCASCGCDQGDHRIRYDEVTGMPYYAECMKHPQCRGFKKSKL